MPQPVPTPVAKPNSSVRLPRKPHRLVAAWIEEDRRSRAIARQYGWPSNESPEIKKRVLCVYDALFKTVEKRGHVVTHERNTLRPVWLVIGGERIDVDVRERILHRRIRLNEVELKDPTNVALNRRWKQTREAAGTLLVEASAAYRSIGKCRWEDTTEVPVEDRLDLILPELEHIAELAAAKRRDDEESHRRWEEERERAQRRKALRERTERRWNLLRGEAACWEEAERLRRFVEAVAERLGDKPPVRAAAWLKWARARIDQFDPLTGNREHLIEALIARRSERDGRAYEDLF